MPKLISISEEDLARLLQENARLSEQVTELQTRGTELVMEMRRLACHEIDLPVKLIRRPEYKVELPLPRYHSEGAVGFDLQTAVTTYLPAGGRRTLPTGIAIELPVGYTAKVLPRSGLSAKEGIVAIDGTIDTDYRGEIHIIVHNVGHDSRNIDAGARIAQLLILPVMRARLVSTDVLSETKRGEGGFGSTGA
jgi:dUTP pyrophosphatase